MSSSACVLVLSALLASTATPPGAVPSPADALPSRPSQADAPQLHALSFDWTRDGLITGAGLALMIGSELVFKPQLAPISCRVCDRAPDGSDALNPVDAWGRELLVARTLGSRATAARWSNLLDNAVLPVSVLGAEYLMTSSSGAPPLWFAEDMLIIFESAALAGVANQVAKLAVGRQRPYAHFLTDNEQPLSADNNLSFYSGHSSLAFSLVVATGTVAELRGYSGRHLVWAIGLPIATAVPLLRMAADKHYLSDVAVGSLAGAAFGLAVPLLLHGRLPPRQGLSLRVAPAPGGAVLLGRF